MTTLTRVFKRTAKRARQAPWAPKHLRKNLARLSRHMTAPEAWAPKSWRKSLGRLSARRIVKAVNTWRWGPLLLVTGRVLAHPWEYYVRRRAAHHLMPPSPALTIDAAAGYGWFKTSDFEQAATVLRLCEQIYEEKRHQIKTPSGARVMKADYLIELLTDDDLVRYPQLVDFCLSPSVVAAAARYLGTVPVLRRVGLLFSLPAPTDAESRLFHLDPEDYCQVKIFINVMDVGKKQGPLTFLPGDVSAAALERIWKGERASGKPSPRYRRWNDREVFAQCTPSDCIELAGPAGTAAFVDTSRCLHFGSRIEPGTFRLVFMAQYLRYHFAFATETNRLKAAAAGRDALAARMLVQRPGPTPYGAVSVGAPPS